MLEIIAVLRPSLGKSEMDKSLKSELLTSSKPTKFLYLPSLFIISREPLTCSSTSQALRYLKGMTLCQGESSRQLALRQLLRVRFGWRSGEVEKKIEESEDYELEKRSGNEHLRQDTSFWMATGHQEPFNVINNICRLPGCILLNLVSIWCTNLKVASGSQLPLEIQNILILSTQSINASYIFHFIIIIF